MISRPRKIKLSLHTTPVRKERRESERELYRLYQNSAMEGSTQMTWFGTVKDKKTLTPGGLLFS